MPETFVNFRPEPDPKSRARLTTLLRTGALPEIRNGGAVWGVWGGVPCRRRSMGVWGRSTQLPEAGGLGAKPPAAGGTGVWGRSPQRSKILHFFAKITSF